MLKSQFNNFKNDCQSPPQMSIDKFVIGEEVLIKKGVKSRDTDQFIYETDIKGTILSLKEKEVLVDVSEDQSFRLYHPSEILKIGYSQS